MTTYKPPKSLVPYFVSDDLISLVMGPYGCVSADTEFLTPGGWKRIDQYKDGDFVAQWHPETGEAEFVKPLQYIKLPCKEFYVFKHRDELSQVLSAEHRVVYQELGAPGDWHECHAGELAVSRDMPTVELPVTFTIKRESAIPWSDAMIQDAVTMYFYGYCTSKSIIPSWWEASPHQLRVIADRLVSLNAEELKLGGRVLVTRSKSRADFAQYCLVASGRKATICRDKGKWVVTAGEEGDKFVIFGEAERDKCHVMPSKDGYKYCFSVPSTYLVLRHNNCVFCTGNSGKTTASIMKVAYHASRMAPCEDGIRRSRCCVVRNTRQMLFDTTIPDFMKWFPPGVAGVWNKTEAKFLLKFGDVECEVLFRGLDDSDDVRRLLSLQLSFGFMDEFREINKDVFEALQGRLGRYPDKTMVLPREAWGKDKRGNPIGGCVTDEGKPNYHLWGASNPPDADTFWEEFISNPPEGTSITIQPSGMSPNADWLEYLPADYYDKLVATHDEDWVDVYVHGKFGKSLAGQPVYRSFNRDIHIAKEPLHYLHSSSYPIIVGVDAALHPAAVFGQCMPDGRLMLLDCCYAEGSGALRFIREKVKPILSNRFPGQPALLVIDPAANTRAQTDERTVLDIIRSEGLSVRMASTNAIQPRISAVDAYLTRMVDGKAGLLIDPEHCKDLIATMATKYRYRARKDGELEDKPDKTHPWSDIADALQYLCLHADASGVFNRSQRNNTVLPVVRSPYVYV